jgi:ABC-type methionine transport system ATPase subunit
MSDVLQGSPAGPALRAILLKYLLSKMRPYPDPLRRACSALDPGSAAKIEETLAELRADHALAIVTHNMEQAARVSDYTAFMYLGEVIEFDDTLTLFTSPKDPRTSDFNHRPVRLKGGDAWNAQKCSL